MTSEWPVQENNFEKREEELTMEEKRGIAQAWSEMVLRSHSVPENILEMKNEEIRKWMSESLMEEIGELCEEWGIVPDENLIKDIHNKIDKKERSEAEMIYIKNCHKRIDDFVGSFDKEKSTRWNSWPKNMKEEGSFNCVGASMLGANLLDQAGIENYIGNPSGHVVNIVRLSDGELWYVDFLNGRNMEERILSKINEVKCGEVIKIDIEALEYKLIPIYETQAFPFMIIGNLDVLGHEAINQSIASDNKGKQVAMRIEKERSDIYSKVDFSKILTKLYSRECEIRDGQEMQEERVRISEERILEFEEVQDYMKSLSDDKKKEFRDSAAKNMDGIEKYFLEGDKSVLPELSLELRHVAELYYKAYGEIRNKDRVKYEEMIKKLFYKSKRYKNS